MKTPRKILIVRFPFVSVFGGGEVHTITMIDLFRAHAIPLEFLGSDTTILGAFRERNLPAQKMWGGKEPVTVWALFLFPLTAPYVSVRLFWNLVRRRIRGTDTVICISLTDKLLATPLARMFGMQVVWIEHVTLDRWLTHNPYRFPYILISRLAHVLAISQTIKKELTELGVPPERIDVRYNGVSLDVPKASRERTDHDVIVGFVGQMTEAKGVDILIRAIAEVRTHLPNVRLVLVGDGPDKKRFIWLAKELGIGERVQFVGFQKDVKRWMLGFDMMVLPSIKRESFGIVLIEAMVCGRPVIGSRYGGIPEIIEHEKTGLLFELGNVKELTQCILRTLQNPETTLTYIRAARKKVEENFSKKAMLEGLETYFHLTPPAV